CDPGVEIADAERNVVVEMPARRHERRIVLAHVGRERHVPERDPRGRRTKPCGSSAGQVGSELRSTLQFCSVRGGVSLAGVPGRGLSGVALRCFWYQSWAQNGCSWMKCTWFMRSAVRSCIYSTIASSGPRM